MLKFLEKFTRFLFNAQLDFIDGSVVDFACFLLFVVQVKTVIGVVTSHAIYWSNMKTNITRAYMSEIPVKVLSLLSLG